MSGEPPAVSAADVVGTVVADAFGQDQGRITAALIHQAGDWDLQGMRPGRLYPDAAVLATPRRQAS